MRTLVSNKLLMGLAALVAAGLFAGKPALAQLQQGDFLARMAPFTTSSGMAGAVSSRSCLLVIRTTFTRDTWTPAANGSAYDMYWPRTRRTLSMGGRAPAISAHPALQSTGSSSGWTSTTRLSTIPMINASTDIS